MRSQELGTLKTAFKTDVPPKIAANSKYLLKSVWDIYLQPNDYPNALMFGRELTLLDQLVSEHLEPYYDYRMMDVMQLLRTIQMAHD